MTVDELITELRRYPGELRVYVRGYEAGIDDLVKVRSVKVHRDVYTAGYYGAHEALDGYGNTWTPDENRSPDATEPGLFLAGGRETNDA